MKRALISVYDKRGIVEFAKGLVKNKYDIVSSGGTAKHLKDNGLEVREVSSITGIKEMLGGRVKTLHPFIFGGILARKEDENELQKLGIYFFDIVVCNLYPFEEVVKYPDVTMADAIENIDIGGVALLRAGAKNFERVILVSDVSDYNWIIKRIEKDGLSYEERLSLAKKAFVYTTRYDSAISDFLSQKKNFEEKLPSSIGITITKVHDLRYGENPHQ
ncbi:unnamed protein product, partial [marine sediment metagenome]